MTVGTFLKLNLEIAADLTESSLSWDSHLKLHAFRDPDKRAFLSSAEALNKHPNSVPVSATPIPNFNNLFR
jgi:hypothetical protein